jgi:hypothetical protein
MRLGLDWQDREKVVLAQHDQQLALLGNGGITEESFQSAQRGVREAYYDLVGVLRPWEGRTFVERKQKELAGLTAMWAEEFGDINDPEVREEVERTAANMRRIAEEGQQSQDEEYELTLAVQRARKARKQ